MLEMASRELEVVAVEAILVALLLKAALAAAPPGKVAMVVLAETTAMPVQVQGEAVPPPV
jgi:hypothetical protein